MYLSMTPIQTFHNLSKSFTVFRHIRYSIIFIFLMESSQNLCHDPLWMSYPLCLHFFVRDLFMSITVIIFISLLGWKYCFWFISSFLVCSLILKNSAFSIFLSKENMGNIFLRVCLANVYLSYPKS